MKPYNDIFDLMDDINDELQFTAEELNRYFLLGHLKQTINEDEYMETESLSNPCHIQNIENDEEEEQQHQDGEAILSEKMSQLSTKSGNETETMSATVKRRRLNSSNTSSEKMKISYDDESEEEVNDFFGKEYEVPKYLLISHKSFTRMAQHIRKTNDSVTVNDIHELVVFMYHIGTLHIKKQITEAYLKSVTGTLQEPDHDFVEVDCRVLPNQVKLLMLKKGKLLPMASDTASTIMEANTEYEKFLHQYIQEITQHIEYIQQKYNDKKTSLIGLTPTIEHSVHIYVKEYAIKPYELKRNVIIAKITYNYELEILKRKYLEEKPNQYQIETAQRLIDRKCQLEKSKRLLMELKQGVFFHKSFISFDALKLEIPMLPNSIPANDKIEQQFSNKHEKLIDYKKLDSLAIHVLEAEMAYYRCQNIFDSELSKMWTNHRNLVKNQAMTTTLIRLLQKRLDNKQQLQLLSRGPIYVPICQTYISDSNQSMHDIVKKQFAPLNYQLAGLFSKHNIQFPLQTEFQQKIYQKFEELFSTPIPSSLNQRAYYERQLIQSIQNSLNKNNLILRRTANNMNTFYVGNMQDFEAKADKFMDRSEDYIVLFDLDEEFKQKPWYNSLNDMIESMNSSLEKLKTNISIKHNSYQQIVADPTKVKLPYLYFLPNISKDNTNILLVPFIATDYSVTWNIGKYLNQLLRPIVDNILRATTFYDEADFIRKLNHYANIEHRLRSTTVLCTITISNFYALDTHKNMLDVVDYFLTDNLASTKLEAPTIPTIRDLLYLFLHNNVFYYKNKIYAFTKGSPNTIPLTETLSNIYLFEWQKKILKEIDENIEFSGRYKDQIFFTWNKSSALELERFIEDFREKHRNVRFQKLIGTTVQFLNAYIENRQGQLFTRVHYDPNIPRYILPYVIRHAKSAISDWLRSALIRAVCYCTSADDFHQERIYLELTLLTSGYSLLFVETHVKHFFNYFHAETMRFWRNQKAYDKFRGQWFNFTQNREKLSKELENFDHHGGLFRLNYMYDFGPRFRFNREFHRLWCAYFQHHPILSEKNTKIMLTSQNVYSLNTLLAAPKSPHLNQP
ncbi:unnamed protein product [Rotaria sp. Silwood1]|nr:unnamed protein product [Rotaria sp. Silwood1]CAF3820335.1 unnamed protein product [Rotaria sp. Silwood1]CAF4724939.1 unnamed protein product [Rotaria sp. Silwood1]CAF4874032.1 unnamed protein product [Rotaria sp. Silwood1]